MFIVGYGSTLSLGSLAQTDRRFAAKPLLPIRVTGWAREFCVPSQTWAGLVLGVRQADPTANGFCGVLIEVPDDDALKKMDSREANYRRVRLDPESVRRYPGGLAEEVLVRARLEGIWLYVPKPDKISYEGQMSRSYVRVCMSGAQNFGQAFLNEFINFTGTGPVDPQTGLTVRTLAEEDLRDLLPLA